MGSIRLEAVNKRFGPHEVIHAVDLDVKDRERVVFVGPSGCGKSTLLRLICGIEDVSEGRILIDGNDVTGIGSARREVAMVFQNYALYPHMTVEENIGFSLRVAGKRPAERVAPVREVASMLQLESLLDRYPKELSGGQKQRVAIGRALVRNPKAFLFDEPLSNLDAALRSEMRLEIARLHKQLGTTMIYVTHDQAEAMTLADRIVVLNAGRIEQIDTPRMLYHAPANIFVARFIGSPTINLIGVTKLSALGMSDVAAKVALRYGTVAQTVGLRPENLGLEAGGSETTSTCLNVEYFGSETIAFLKGPGGLQLAVKAAGEPNWQPGQSYAVIHRGEEVLAFDGHGDALRRVD